MYWTFSHFIYVRIIWPSMSPSILGCTNSHVWYSIIVPVTNSYNWCSKLTVRVSSSWSQWKSISINLYCGFYGTVRVHKMNVYWTVIPVRWKSWFAYSHICYSVTVQISDICYSTSIMLITKVSTIAGGPICCIMINFYSRFYRTVRVQIMNVNCTCISTCIVI